MPILKLKKDDPKKELEFEVNCSLRYTPAQRFRQLLNLSQQVLKLADKYETSKTTQVIKRKIG